jgi:hypothetical protein
MRILLFSYFFFMSIVAFSQKDSALKKGRKVQITDWKKVAYVVVDDFWKSTKDQIIKQVGKDEFEKIKTFSGRNVPCAMQIFCEDKDGSPKKNIDSLANKQSKLTVFKIADFIYTNERGKQFGYSVLRVPYENNKDWDPNVNWDTVYFLVRDNLISQIKYTMGK